MHILAAHHIGGHRQRLEPFDTPSAERRAPSTTRALSAASRRAAASSGPLLAPVTTKTLFSI
ncbi:hypothetical protein [Burkholderia gladioli]|uniref:hypothetical protein n=1 Tax=Burkholderia gladioli TaxID=28095 RepID=UPI00163E5834|nr:hypothetical protein [Burkholderia gladioli]